MSENEIDRDVRAVFAVSDEEAAAIAAGDIVRYLPLLAEEAVFMPPNSPERSGEDLRRWLGEFLQNVAVVVHSSHHGETLVTGNMAFHVFRCTWTVSPKSDRKPSLLHFKGLHLLRRQLDGSWKITREIWNLSPAP
ncbi:MAG TPA: DUF4440 domain-containing protein [Acidobacteriota bacterium]|nr:DUF4440 domain-containing protein [Acidobacteriota bacterium]